MSVIRRCILAGIFFVLATAPSFPQSGSDLQGDAAAPRSQSTQNNQSDFAAHVARAKEHLDAKRPDLAIPELQAAAAINPENVEVQGNLGVLLYFQRKLADAIPHLRAAVEHQPDLGKLQGLLGLAEVRTQDPVDGQKDLETAFPQIPDQKFKVEVGLELLSLYAGTGELDEAGTLATQLRKIAPDDPEVLYAAYRTYSDLWGESMLALSIAAPDSAQMQQVLAHEEARQGNNDAAIAHLRKALTLNPQLPGAHFELAELLYSAQDAAVKNQAEAEYRAALKENPQDEKSIVRLAEIDATKGDSQQALKEYTRASELQPTDADAKLGMAKVLTDTNQGEKAQTVLEQAVQIDPTNATAHYRLAAMYRKAGRTEDARRETELYKKYKDMKEKLRTLYKELQVQPKDATTDETDPK